MKNENKKIMDNTLENVQGGAYSDTLNKEWDIDYSTPIYIDRCPYCKEAFDGFCKDGSTFVYDPQNPITCPKCGKLIIFSET